MNTDSDFVDGVVIGSLLAGPTPVIEGKTRLGTFGLTALAATIQGAIIGAGVAIGDFVGSLLASVIDGLFDN